MPLYIGIHKKLPHKYAKSMMKIPDKGTPFCSTATTYEFNQTLIMLISEKSIHFRALKSMKVSIIIPTYNREKLLKETLGSLLLENTAPHEVIVVDDNSSDNSIVMLRDYATKDTRLKILIKPAGIPKGPSASRNIGARHATGDYIQFFDSDDLIEAGFYQTLQKELLKYHPDAFLCRMKWFEELPTNIKGESGAFTRKEFFSKGIMQEHNFWTPNIIWKKELLLNGKMLFNETLSMSEDIEFAIRKLTEARKIEFANDLFILIRRHTESLTHISNLARECNIAESRYFAHKSVLDAMQGREISRSAIIKCSFCMRQSLLFLLKINGPCGFFMANIFYGFHYSPASKWPGFLIEIAKNLLLFLRKGKKWAKEGGFGRAF